MSIVVSLRLTFEGEVQMRKREQAKKTNNVTHNTGVLRTVLLSEIVPPPNNVRREFDEKGLADLTESIRRQGVLQPILVREIQSSKAGKGKYEVVAGERRFRAARLAGLKEIPAQIREMSDEEALGAQIVENLQREDVHPLDEAAGFLRLKQEMKLEIRDIAARLARDVRYIARRLALTNLIEEARGDHRRERITLAHALEICRLAPEIQKEALAACYETKSVLNKNRTGYDYLPDKGRPARPLRFLQEWLTKNVYLNLKQAPFDPRDSRLREDGLACADCPQRTGHDKTLFADLRDGDRCLNPGCFQGKLRKFVEVTKAAVENKQKRPAALISPYYGASKETEGALGRDQYHLIARRADRCASAERAVVADGSEIGRVKWICREKTCRDHAGCRIEPSSHSSSGSPSIASSENRNKRKQELFEIKVNEEARKRVMKEAARTYGWPLDREHLNEAVKEFFRRIPSEHQRTVCEVVGMDESEAEKLRFNQDAALQYLAGLDDQRLAQFLMLCSFAHYGANQYKNNEVDQSEVIRLSEERGVDYALVDAEVRLELCPKKYRDDHEAYLGAVKNGEKMDKPVVFERSSLEERADEGEQTSETRNRAKGQVA